MSATSGPDHMSLPSPEVLREIERKQTERAQQIKERRARELAARPTEEIEDGRQRHAAEIIQRNFRGYRDRRVLKGHGLDPSTRWMEALKETKYNNTMKPRERNTSSPEARARWKKAGALAQRVGSDATSESEEDVQDDAERARIRENKKKLKKEREKYSKTIGLEYYLEAVDHKHRYGSSLRKYHEVWKTSDTKENFFYWLDHGEGKDVDLEERPRTRLDRECVRYLSREERKKYLVHIDKQGRFYWEKNGQLISTTTDFKDSYDGIVSSDDKTPTWREVTTGEADPPKPDEDDYSGDDDSISGMSTGSHEDKSKYTNNELHDAKGLAKLNHLSVNTITNNLMRKTTKKNTWIFVADTSFRLYIGIKQSGAFQHSSFLRGARVSAAGLIKIKDGQLRALSPLSGHYAPPVRNFKEFVKTVKQEGADLSRCSISRSYAILLGLEGYIGVKKQAKNMKQGVKDLFQPDEKRKREEAAKDKSKSAELERQHLAKEEDLKRQDTLGAKLMKKMSISPDDPQPRQSGGGPKREGSLGDRLLQKVSLKSDDDNAGKLQRETVANVDPQAGAGAAS
ncbi:hypothetical protein AMS68_001727 [Peltaster fructicola]|uniref:IQ domain-containing protein IQM6 n=1 Tax=Peltaster fructicola TaxID=286661 RepID=A0A6H0XNZ6_9PEZI|nr:hypothetical protein AMS68_001727 [Peltaster fructicola]